MSQRPRLFDFNDERESIVEETAARVFDEKLALAKADPTKRLEYVLNEAAFRELERLTQYGADHEIGEIGSFGFWRGLAKRARSAGEGEKKRALKRLLSAYSGDIAGNFDPKVYQFANQVLPLGLSLLFNTQRGSGLSFRKLSERIKIEGDIDRLKRLSSKGTLIVAPTHLSNLDSIVLGWALAESGLPPVTYGAGKNLFTNKLLTFFMQNLGAYKVDRRIKHGLYKSCLKAYSEVLLERGFHSLFFPGGTRSRSGEVEQKLKLGLLGTGLTAYVRHLKAGRERKMFVVPVTLNFNLVLEAEGLVKDYLKAVGKEYFLLPDDPFDSPFEVARFATKLASMETSMVIRFGEPLDILGHNVDEEGRSYDGSGREVDLPRFFELDNGEIGLSKARDRIYTRQAGEALCRAFARNTVLMPTQFVSYVLFEAARRQFPNLKLAQVMRFAQDLQIPWSEVNADAANLQREVKRAVFRGEVRALEPLLSKSAPELVDIGLRALNMYHSKPPVEATGQGARLGNMELLYYYSNRLRVLPEFAE